MDLLGEVERIMRHHLLAAVCLVVAGLRELDVTVCDGILKQKNNTYID